MTLNEYDPYILNQSVLSKNSQWTVNSYNDKKSKLKNNYKNDDEGCNAKRIKIFDVD